MFALFLKGLHFGLTDCSIKLRIQMKNNTQHPLKRKSTGPIDKNEKIPFGLNGLKFNYELPLIYYRRFDRRVCC